VVGGERGDNGKFIRKVGGRGGYKCWWRRREEEEEEERGGCVFSEQEEEKERSKNLFKINHKIIYNKIYGYGL